MIIGYKLYVMGGYTLTPSKEPVMEIEIFDIETLQWYEFDYLMLPPLYGFATIRLNPFELITLGGKSINN